MKRLSIAVSLAIAATGLVHTETARSAAILQITEMWPGGLPGVDATSDWFELSNLGDTAATGIDGTLFYDDNSNDPLSADPMVGIESIAPGESVVYLISWENQFNSIQEDALAAFTDMWAPPNELQIGVVTFGGGLGGQGDAVNIFDGNTAEANTIDHEEYVGPTDERSFVSESNGDWTPRMAEAGVLGAYLGLLSADDMGAPPPVGSPGVVPEPTAFSLLGISLLVSLIHYRRQQKMRIA